MQSQPFSEDLVSAPSGIVYPPHRGRRSAGPSHLPASRAGRQQAVFFIGGYVLTRNRLKEVLIGQKGRRGVRYIGSIPAMAILPPQRQLLQSLRMLAVYGCEFANLPESPAPHALTEERMHDCLWVEPSQKVLISFDGWTPTGHLHRPQLLKAL